MWRPMNSLLVLRSQVNAIAPYRSKIADGLVGDEDHQQNNPNSGHNPHYVAGVGDEIVTALDLTHSPDRGFDSYKFAETLRRNRDQRIRYVISNRRIFSSYVVGSTPAWEWRPYSGSNPHTGHAHIQVLDARISDTHTRWNLEGFENDMTPGQQYVLHVINYRIDAILHMRTVCKVPAYTASNGDKFPEIVETNDLAAAIKALALGGMTPEDMTKLVTAVTDSISAREADADRARADVLDPQ